MRPIRPSARVNGPVETEVAVHKRRARRQEAAVDGEREATRIAATLGGEIERTRKRRRWTQAMLGARAGLSQERISDLERGDGASTPLGTWVAVGMALDRPIAISFSRDLEPDEPRDAGHLRAQELVLLLARQVGRHADFELPTRPADPARVCDIVLRDRIARTVLLVEIWNRLDDLGAAARSTSRKVAEAGPLAVLAAGDGPAFRTASCWLVVDTAANRRLIMRYPEILSARFPGSSVGWAQCLLEGAAPPTEPGIAWIDPRAGRIVPMRLRRKMT